MNDKITLIPLTTPQEVDEFIASEGVVAVFKAGTCHKTMQGFSVLETFFKRHELPIGYIKVVDWRPASNYISEITGVVHQSPQFILFKDKKAIYDVDNWDITPEAVEPVFSKYVPLREGLATVQNGNLTPYLSLIDDFLADKLDAFEFQDKWVVLFKDDANLRPEKEFNLLSRLFGDPDAYHGGLHQLGAPVATDLKPRVQQLKEELLAL